MLLLSERVEVMTTPARRPPPLSRGGQSAKDLRADADYWHELETVLLHRRLYGWTYRQSALFIRRYGTAKALDGSMLDITGEDRDAIMSAVKKGELYT